MYAQGKTDIKSTNMTHLIGYMSTDPDDYTLNVTRNIHFNKRKKSHIYSKFL